MNKKADTVAVAVSLKPTTHRLASDRWRAAETIFWLLPVAAYFLFPGHRVLASQIMIIGLFGLSLDLILGYAGIVSLGHAAFFGIGAYTAGLLAVHGWGEPLSGLLLAGAAAAVIGYLVGFLVVRGADIARLMVTLGICFLFYEAANKAAFITGGVDGMGVPMWNLFGQLRFDIYGRTAFWYSSIVAFVIFIVVRRLVHSPFGLSLQGLREGPKRMPALGVPVRRRQIAVFTIAAGIAGIAGALLAQTTQFVGLDVLSFTRSAELLVMLVLGGIGRLYGGFLGAAVFMVAQNYLSGLNPVYWQFWLGLLLVAIVLFAHGGILGGLATLYQGLRARKK